MVIFHRFLYVYQAGYPDVIWNRKVREKFSSSIDPMHGAPGAAAHTAEVSLDVNPYWSHSPDSKIY